MTAYSWAPVRDEKILKNVLFSVGPLAIGVDASLFTFQSYKSGIYDDENCGNTMEKLNHAMLLVGYGVDDNWGDYWLLKNSYGKSWGEFGKN
jgi:cathepsin L